VITLVRHHHKRPRQQTSQQQHRIDINGPKQATKRLSRNKAKPAVLAFFLPAPSAASRYIKPQRSPTSRKFSSVTINRAQRYIASDELLTGNL